MLWLDNWLELLPFHIREVSAATSLRLKQALYLVQHIIYQPVLARLWPGEAENPAVAGPLAPHG